MSISQINILAATAAADAGRSSMPAPVSQPVSQPVATAAHTDAAMVRTSSDKQVNQPTKGEVMQAVTTLNKFAGVVANNFKFSVDETSGQVVVKVIDSRTNEMLRQIPNAEALALSRSFDTTTGLLISQKA